MKNFSKAAQGRAGAGGRKSSGAWDVGIGFSLFCIHGQAGLEPVSRGKDVVFCQMLLLVLKKEN